MGAKKLKKILQMNNNTLALNLKKTYRYICLFARRILFTICINHVIYDLIK